MFAALFAGSAISALAAEYQTVINEDTDWNNLFWTPSDTPGIDDTATISSDGRYGVTIDGSVVDPLALSNLRLERGIESARPYLVMKNGATLQLLNSVNNTNSSFYFASLQLTDSTIVAGSGTLGDPSTYVGDKKLSFWFGSLTATNSTIYGGISSWHGEGNTINLTDSKVYAKGVSLFEFQGNGDTTATFDNSTLTLSKSDAGSWGHAIYALAHNATSAKPNILTLQNGTQFIAGETTEYGVVSGGSSFMGTNPISDAYVEINILDGSKFVGSSMVVANNVGSNSAKYLINVSGTSADRMSSAWFADVYLGLSASDTPLAPDSFLTQIAVGDYADVRMSGLTIGRSYNADNIAKSGKASVTVGSNSSLSIINSGGNTQNMSIGADGGLEGGTSQLLVNGNSSSVKSWYVYMGNSGSTGGENILRIENNSSDVSNRNEVWNYGISLINSTLEGSTVKNYAYIGGNTYLRGGRVLEGGDNSLNFFVARNLGGNGSVATASGTSVLEFDSSNGLIEFGYLYQVQVGNSASTGGTGELIIRGSNFKRRGDNFILLANNLGVYGGVGFDKDTNLVGGILTMAADASGFTKISADRIFLTGLLNVDFSGMRGTYEDGISFDLLEYRNGTEDAKGSREAWLTLCESIAGGDYSQVNVITRDDSDYVEFALNGSTLSVTYYSSVPEPAAVAAIFGTLALALAAYRRRR